MHRYKVQIHNIKAKEFLNLVIEAKNKEEARTIINQRYLMTIPRQDVRVTIKRLP